MKPALVLHCVMAAVCTLISPAALAAGKAGAHAHGAHEHGAVKMDVAVDKGRVMIELRTPLDSLLGFERAPRNDKERRAAAEVLAQLRGGATLFVLDAAAQCQSTKTEVMAGVIEPGPSKVGSGATAAAATKDEHADLEASYEFTCQQPQHLRMLNLGWFEAFPRTQRIDVQVAGPQGQSRATLKRGTRIVKLVR